MKLLLQYLSRYKPLVALALLLAAINQVFSLMDPYIFGRFIIDPFAKQPDKWTQHEFIMGITKGLLFLVGTAMVSRIAKAFQDYTVNVVIQKFGARIYTDGLRHALRLPYQEFEDQRSGETLSVLQKVRTDTEKFISVFVNVLFATLVGIVFVIIYAFTLNSWLVVIYLGGAVLLGMLTSVLS
ncbi:MAG: ABC transporter ATP-binding protein, partial [Chitinophagaceae bacterium]|nr:ABC transporter ATP-binding protein [Chitinophagaceae bacterium]